MTDELDRTSHTWLKALSVRLDKRDIQDLLEKIRQMTEKNDREIADSVLEVSIGANRHIVDELMGDDSMFETLMEIMEPKITEIRKRDKEEYLQVGRLEGKQEGIQEGIRGAIEMLRNLQYQDAEIRSEIIKQYGLTEDEADRYLRV